VTVRPATRAFARRNRLSPRRPGSSTGRLVAPAPTRAVRLLVPSPAPGEGWLGWHGRSLAGTNQSGGGRLRFSGRSCTRPSWSRHQNCQTSTAVAGDRRAAHGVQSPDAAADCRRFAPHYTEGRCRRRASRLCAITVVAERGGAVATCAPGCGGGRGRGPAGGEGWGAANARRVENTTAGHTVPPSAPPQCPCGRLTTKPVRQLQPQLWGPPVGVGLSAGAAPGCATAAAAAAGRRRRRVTKLPHGGAVRPRCQCFFIGLLRECARVRRKCARVRRKCARVRRKCARVRRKCVRVRRKCARVRRKCVRVRRKCARVRRKCALARRCRRCRPVCSAPLPSGGGGAAFRRWAHRPRARGGWVGRAANPPL